MRRDFVAPSILAITHDLIEQAEALAKGCRIFPAIAVSRSGSIPELAQCLLSVALCIYGWPFTTSETASWALTKSPNRAGVLMLNTPWFEVLLSKESPASTIDGGMLNVQIKWFIPHEWLNGKRIWQIQNVAVIPIRSAMIANRRTAWWSLVRFRQSEIRGPWRHGANWWRIIDLRQMVNVYCLAASILGKVINLSGIQNFTDFMIRLRFLSYRNEIDYAWLRVMVAYTFDQCLPGAHGKWTICITPWAIADQA